MLLSRGRGIDVAVSARLVAEFRHVRLEGAYRDGLGAKTAPRDRAGEIEAVFSLRIFGFRPFVHDLEASAVPRGPARGAVCAAAEPVFYMAPFFASAFCICTAWASLTPADIEAAT